MLIATPMWVLRRLMASLLAATLLLAGPLAIPKQCTDCPPGCPMHGHEGGREPAKKKPGCHRAADPLPAGTVCLRSACGHDVTTESGTILLALRARPVEAISPTPGPRIVVPALIVASLDAPEPPLHPPRSART